MSHSYVIRPSTDTTIASFPTIARSSSTNWRLTAMAGRECTAPPGNPGCLLGRRGEGAERVHQPRLAGRRRQDHDRALLHALAELHLHDGLEPPPPAVREPDDLVHHGVGQHGARP